MTAKHNERISNESKMKRVLNRTETGKKQIFTSDKANVAQKRNLTLIRKNRFAFRRIKQ
jgi:hypothetical protein